MINKISQFKTVAKSLNRDPNSINELKMWVVANQIFEVSIDNLIPSEPSVTSDSYDAIKNKLENDEDIDPIKVAILNDEYVVLDGNNRVKAFLDFGKSTIPAILIDLDKNRSRKKYYLVVIREFSHLKGFTDLPVDKNKFERQKRYSGINFIYCSKDKIECVLPESNSILISIAGVNDDFANISASLYKDVLQLRFSDVTRDFGKFVAFKESQARTILNFIDKNLPVDYVYVNCEQGKSRSAGVVTALEKIYNGKDVFIPTHNILVKDILLSI
jgi:hypothetical protein